MSSECTNCYSKDVQAEDRIAELRTQNFKMKLKPNGMQYAISQPEERKEEQKISSLFKPALIYSGFQEEEKKQTLLRENEWQCAKCQRVNTWNVNDVFSSTCRGCRQ